MSSESVGQRLGRWRASKDLGRRINTQKFHREIVDLFNRYWLDLEQSVESVTFDQLTDFAKSISPFCPSRYNTAVSALRFITEKAMILKRRRRRFRQFTPPSQMQFTALLTECDKLPKSNAGVIVRFLSLTGLRISEARALTWDRVSEEHIEVCADSAKNGKRRRVPLLPGARELLAKMRARATSAAVLPHRNIRTGLAKACKRAGLPVLSYHSFRHIFATRAIEAGVDLPTVASWLGHQDRGVLLAECYMHVLTDHSRRMAEKVRIVI